MASEQELHEQILLDFYGEKKIFPALSETREKHYSLIPNDLLINLVEDGRHILEEILVNQGYSLEIDTTTPRPNPDDPLIMKEEGAFWGVVDVVSQILHGTELDPTYSLDPKYGYTGADFTPEEAATWGVDKLIKDLSEDKFLTHLMHDSDSSFLLGAFDAIPGIDSPTDINEALPYLSAVWNRSILPRDEMRGDDWYLDPDDPEQMEEYMDTIMHETFLHGMGGSHEPVGGTFFGGQHDYNNMMHNMIEGLKDTESYQNLQDYVYNLIEEDNARRQQVRSAQAHEPWRQRYNFYQGGADAFEESTYLKDDKGEYILNKEGEKMRVWDEKWYDAKSEGKWYPGKGIKNLWEMITGEKDWGNPF